MNTQKSKGFRPANVWRDFDKRLVLPRLFHDFDFMIKLDMNKYFALQLSNCLRLGRGLFSTFFHFTSINRTSGGIGSDAVFKVFLNDHLIS